MENKIDEAKKAIREALLKRAYGYEYEEKEIIASRNGKPEKMKITKKHVPPDLQAVKEIIKLMKTHEW